ncbi:unnamed protein product [Mucor hiemalis]
MAVTLDRQKSEGHYFRKGRVKETQQKVLTEEEVVELEKQRTRRQLEVAQLVKKSAVKNNPLFKKLEKRSFTSPTPSPSTSTTNLAVTLDEANTNLDGALVTEALKDVAVEEEPVIRPKRNSKVISSLQKKSYVSTSIFVQADEFEPRQSPPMAIPSVNGLDDKKDTMFISQEGACVTQQSLDDDEAQCTTTTILSNEPSDIEYEDHHPIYYSNDKDIILHETDDDDGDYYELETNEELIESLGVGEETKIHPVQSAEVKKDTLYTHSLTSSDEDEYEDDSDNEIEQATPVQFATRLVSPVYKSVVLLSEEEKLNHLEEKRQQESSSSSSLEQLSPTFTHIIDEPQSLRVESSISNSSSGSSSSSSSVVESSVNQIYSNSDINLVSSTTPNPRSSSLLQIKTENLLSKSSPELVTPVRPQRSELRRGSNNSNNNVSPVKLIENESKEKKRMSGTQKAAWTMSMSSWAAILDREFNLDELDQEKKLKQQQQQQQQQQPPLQDQIIEESIGRPSIDYLSGHGSDSSSKLQLSEDEIEVIFQGSLSRSSLSPTSPLSSTLTNFDHASPPPTPPTRRQPPSIVTTPLPRAPQIEPAFPRLQNHKSVSRKPLTASLSESTMRSSMVSNMPTKQHSVPASINIKHRGDHGKLYLHVNDISDILLPLPKERAYVRCVVSDGRFEYMSRYEILSQNINFDYECVIDTHPDMIITISLHVRPDYVMKSRKPFSRLFSSKKKKESLSGYVNKDDGAIGQARFALAHMLPVCMETTYLAGFHCFNAWYSRSFKERHRQKKQDPDQDVLKVVGNFDVEMFYLPVKDYNKPFPRNLRECDMIIKQLHQSVRDSSEKYNTF